MPKGGLNLNHSLLFTLVHFVLEISICCSLNVVLFADVRRRCCMGCCTASYYYVRFGIAQVDGETDKIEEIVN